MTRKVFAFLIGIATGLSVSGQNDWDTSTSGQITYTNGNVGIGVVPSEKLTVGGNIELSGNYSLRFNTNSTDPYNALSFRHQGDSKWIMDYGTGSTQNLRFIRFNGGSGTTFLNFDYANTEIEIPSGNVGIGTTSPTSRLTIQQSGTLGGKYNASKAYLRVGDGSTNLLMDGNEIYSNHILAFGSSYSSDFVFRNVDASGYTDLLNIKPDGKVGIGINSPSAKLHVSTGTSGDAVLKLEADTDNNNEGDNVRIEMLQDGGSLGAFIGFNQSWGGGSGSNADNLFRIGTRYSNVSTYDRLVINTQNGYVGIGTTTPSEKFHISGSGMVRSIVESSDNHAYYVVEGASGKGSFVDYKRKGDGRIWHTGLRNANNNFEFRTNDQNSVLTLKENGTIGIGTNNPDEKLTVKGKIHSEEVRVDLSVPGPDYVFEPTYDLRSLEETEAYIKENKHLPEVPSAKEMEANGVQLGEMNMLLLKKIEELTLHQIEMMKIIKAQQKEIEELKSN